MANTIKIKRSTTTATPSALAEGELAYSESSNNLFVGTSGSNVANIGGKIGVTVQAYDANIVSDATYQSTANDFTTTLKNKLDGVASSANNYVHPTTAGNKHIPTLGAAGQFLKYSASGTAVWAADNNTVYTHPTGAGYNHIPTGGTVGQILKNTASGTATWQADNNTTYSVGDGGLSEINFTSADNTKLDGIATSANNYSLPASVVHDTEVGALHATDALRISGHTLSLYKGNGTSESVTIPDNNTTYSVGDGGLTQNNFTTALKTNYDNAAAWYTTMTTADADSVIDTVNEIISAFQNHAEGLNLITELDAKLTGSSTIDGGTF